MYLPTAFEETRTEVLHDLMRQAPLATIVAQAADGLEANHLPLQLFADDAPHGTLRGHIARANPLCGAAPGQEVLAIFHGAQGYVSPGWFPGKHEHGKVVPTWNYVVVHAYGELRLIDEPRWLREHLEQLTAVHEAGRASPWQVTDAPQEFTERLIRALLGVEIRISRLQGKWKLSQNRPVADRNGLLEGLLADGPASELARLVRESLER